MEMMALQREYTLSRQKSSAERAALEAQHSQALTQQNSRHQAELRQHIEAAAQAAAVHEATSAREPASWQMLARSPVHCAALEESSMLCRCCHLHVLTTCGIACRRRRW